MSERLTPQQFREFSLRLNGDPKATASVDTDLEHVETYQISPEAQAQLDREYMRFLEAKNSRIENLCRQAQEWIERARIENAALQNARALLAQCLQR
jgi:hypothetical protein